MIEHLVPVYTLITLPIGGGSKSPYSPAKPRAPPSASGPRPRGLAQAQRRVERCVGRLKQWRGVATRYEKRAVNYQAMVVIASLMVWLPS